LLHLVKVIVGTGFVERLGDPQNFLDVGDDITLFAEVALVAVPKPNVPVCPIWVFVLPFSHHVKECKSTVSAFQKRP